MLYPRYSEKGRSVTIVNLTQQALWCVDGIVQDPVRSTQSEIYRSANVERMDLWFVNEYLSAMGCGSLFCNLIDREKG